jgi:hypothetical protein
MSCFIRSGSRTRVAAFDASEENVSGLPSTSRNVDMREMQYTLDCPSRWTGDRARSAA